jgi:transcription initiation factor IIE alpha subunit
MKIKLDNKNIPYICCKECEKKLDLTEIVLNEDLCNECKWRDK